MKRARRFILVGVAATLAVTVAQDKEKQTTPPKVEVPKVVKKAPKVPRKTPPRSQPPTLENMDADKSGGVSKKEFVAFHTARLTKFFESLDADKDQNLSGPELSKIQRRPTSAGKPSLQPRPKP